MYRKDLPAKELTIDLPIHKDGQLVCVAPRDLEDLSKQRFISLNGPIS